MDRYTICLLAWFFGTDTDKVEQSEWTQEEIDKAQAYCEKMHADPIAYYGK